MDGTEGGDAHRLEQGIAVIGDDQHRARGQFQGQSRKDGAGAQGGDEGIELHIAHQNAVYKAADRANADGAEDAEEAVVASHHDLGAHAAQECQHTVHRKDAGAENLRRIGRGVEAEGDDAHIGLLPQNAQKVIRGDEQEPGAAGPCDLEENLENHHHGQHGQEHGGAVEAHEPAPTGFLFGSLCGGGLFAHACSASFPLSVGAAAPRA